MNFVRLLPPILSLLLLSAHFSRSGIFLFSLILMMMPLLLFIKQTWVAKLIQIILILGSIEWIRTTYVYVIQRQSIGEPYFRLIIIIGAVALVTGLSALMFKNKSIKQRYNL